MVTSIELADMALNASHSDVLPVIPGDPPINMLTMGVANTLAATLGTLKTRLGANLRLTKVVRTTRLGKAKNTLELIKDSMEPSRLMKLVRISPALC